MGEIADYYLEEMMKEPSFYPKRKYSGHENKAHYKEGKSVEREVKKRFKSLAGSNGEYSIVIEQGVYRETVAVSFDKKKYRARGFLAKDVEESTSYYKRTNDFAQLKEVINMHDLFANLANLLNNLYSADLITEASYNAALDAYEPFISEALEFSEIEGFLEPSTINNNKKKRIKRRER